MTDDEFKGGTFSQCLWRHRGIQKWEISKIEEKFSDASEIDRIQMSIKIEDKEGGRE